MPSFRNPDIPSLALAVQVSGPHAEFGRCLNPQGISGPDNLVAMTTVTSPARAGRIAELRKVPSRFKGLSCEPLFAPLAPGPVRH
jgi:protein gp37